MEIRKLFALVLRNMKCYFKDKFLFFVSLMTPMILLVLFVTFLRGVYISSFEQIFEAAQFTASDDIINGLAGSWLLSSIISVSAVTVAICSNAVMIQDKIEGPICDLAVSPVKGTTVSISYFIANFIVTLLVMLCVLAVGSIYLAIVGWYIPFLDFLMILVDMICAVLFGTLLSGVIESFISTQGGLSALSTLVSSMYGFICGAYMPLSQFAEGMRNMICVLPGTYSVGMLRKHFMSGYVEKLAEMGLPDEGQKALLDGFDGHIYVGSTQMPLWSMYVILLSTCALLFAAYVLIVIFKNKKISHNVVRMTGKASKSKK
ncbi:MAG: ABC transporter permease [Clostridiales bacterium]|nr:ABC transporter permease [Clostridiales bacterium]